MRIHSHVFFILLRELRALWHLIRGQAAASEPLQNSKTLFDIAGWADTDGLGGAETADATGIVAIFFVLAHEYPLVVYRTTVGP